MQRYLIAISLPEDLATILRSSYLATYKEPLRVRFLHTTLIPPFTIEDDQKINLIQGLVTSIPEYNTKFVFEKPDVFVRKRKILYLPIVDPNHELQTTYHELLSTLTPHIQIAATDFKPDELPEFKPHVTLSYKFTGDPTAFIPPKEPFFLPSPQLLEEKGPGLWEPITR